MTGGVNRLPGPIEFVTVGTEVWSKERRRAVNGGEDAVGGICVAVTEKFDEETGGIDRAFLVIDPYNTRPFLRWAILPESEVDREAIMVPEAKTITRLCRRLAEQIAYAKRYHERKGPATSDEAKWTLALWVLTGVLFGPGGDHYGQLAPLAAATPAAPRPTFPVNPAAFVD